MRGKTDPFSGNKGLICSILLAMCAIITSSSHNMKSLFPEKKIETFIFNIVKRFLCSVCSRFGEAAEDMLADFMSCKDTCAIF